MADSTAGLLFGFFLLKYQPWRFRVSTADGHAAIPCRKSHPLRSVDTVNSHNPIEWLLCASSLCGRLWPIAAEPEITMSGLQYAQEFCRSIENCWQNLVRSPQNRPLYKCQSSRSNKVTLAENLAQASALFTFASYKISPYLKMAPHLSASPASADHFTDGHRVDFADVAQPGPNDPASLASDSAGKASPGGLRTGSAPHASGYQLSTSARPASRLQVTSSGSRSSGESASGKRFWYRFDRCPSVARLR